MKLWRVSAWSSIPHKKNSHRFSSCEVLANSRKDAITKAINNELVSDKRFWTAGAGHCMTAKPIKENLC